MSFGKAKLKRFNEIKESKPAPFTLSKNNVKEELKTKIKTPGSECSSDTGSIKSTPCFRTPTILGKKKTVILPTKPKSQIFSKEQLELEALKDKIVECENKDASITDLREQVEELKQKVIVLDSEKAKLISYKANYEESIFLQNREYSKQMQQLMEGYEENMILFKSKKDGMEDNINLLKKEIQSLKRDHQNCISKLKGDCDRLQVSCHQLIKIQNKVLETKNAELVNKEKELAVLEKECITLQRKHALEIENINKTHRLEIQDIEFEFLKTMTELQNEKDIILRKTNEIEEKARREIEELHQIFDKEKLTIYNEIDQKIILVEKQMAHTYEQELKVKLLEQEQNYENRLDSQQKESDAILKECQTISEYNIIQSEIEKNKIKTELELKCKDFDLLQDKYEVSMHNIDILKNNVIKLENNLSEIGKELNDTRQKLSDELNEKENIINTITKEKASYEISFKTYQKTIDVLKKRLVHSDQDVEQLKAELAKCEETILDYESKCLQLTSDLQQAHLSIEELEMQFESTLKLNRIEIEQMKDDLCKKVNLYKDEVDKYTMQIQQEEVVKNDISNFKKEIAYLKTLNEQYEFEMRRGQNDLDGYHLRELDWCIRTESYENTMQQMENELKSKNEEIDDLKTKIARLENQNDVSHRTVDVNNSLNDEEKSIFAKYIQVSSRYDQILQKFEILQKENFEKNKVISDLYANLQDYSTIQKKCIEQEQKLEDMSVKLGAFEKLRESDSNASVTAKLESLEEERDFLLGKLENLEVEFKQMSQKYADLVGHQNNKQKIKHLCDLKQKNEEISQQNVDLSVKLQAQKKSMEKLKKENADLKKRLKKQKYISDGKENVGSPTRSLNLSRVESPLRERN